MEQLRYDKKWQGNQTNLKEEMEKCEGPGAAVNVRRMLVACTEDKRSARQYSRYLGREEKS